MYLQISLNKLFLLNRLIIPLFFFTSLSFAQQITIKDQVTNENLPDVVIFNEDKTESIITDFNGLVDLNLFSSDENIFFSITRLFNSQNIKD